MPKVTYLKEKSPLGSAFDFFNVANFKIEGQDEPATIWHDSNHGWCLHIGQAVVLDNESLKEIAAWCKKNHHTAFILDMFHHAGRRWDSQFVSPNDLLDVIESDCATDDEKQSARQALEWSWNDTQRRIVQHEIKPKIATISITGPGHIYLVACGNYYKIGLTTDVQRRVGELNKQSLNEPITLVFSLQTNNMYALEKRLHEQFASKRVAGEWFELSLDDVELIKSMGREV